jgi:hypothetical protein
MKTKLILVVRYTCMSSNKRKPANSVRKERVWRTDAGLLQLEIQILNAAYLISQVYLDMSLLSSRYINSNHTASNWNVRLCVTWRQTALQEHEEVAECMSVVSHTLHRMLLKSGRVRCVGHVACRLSGTRDAHKVFVRKLEKGQTAWKTKQLGGGDWYRTLRHSGWHTCFV